MQEPPPLDQIVQSLEKFAVDVARVLAEPGISWQRCRKDGEWTLTEVVCHLRDVEREVHQTRIETLMEEDGAFLPGAVADEWVVERAYAAQDGMNALDAFLEARAQTVALVRDLDQGALKRQGQHAFFGPTTLHELLYLIVQHDEAHWEQITGLLAL